MNFRKKLFSLCLFVLGVALIEWLGHLLTMSSVRDWYVTLQKPSWTPPAYVFGPVWTILYAMIAIAGWRVFIKMSASGKKTEAFWMYSLQLTCNLLWSFFFFFLKNPLFALIDILTLLLLIIFNIKAFYRIDKVAGILLVPYLIWTFYAFLLNFAIWSLNR